MEELRRDLPPPVVPGAGQKTQGRWLDPDSGTVQQSVSGDDAQSRRVEDFLRDQGMPNPPQRTRDVEMKLAVLMRDRNISHLDLVLNNVPCRGPLGCDGMLPILLPAGTTLTVHGPNFRKTYTGGAQPWWS